jgi:hypothetical protein
LRICVKGAQNKPDYALGNALLQLIEKRATVNMGGLLFGRFARFVQMGYSNPECPSIPLRQLEAVLPDASQEGPCRPLLFT